VRDAPELQLELQEASVAAPSEGNRIARMVDDQDGQLEGQPRHQAVQLRSCGPGPGMAEGVGRQVVQDQEIDIARPPENLHGRNRYLQGRTQQARGGGVMRRRRLASHHHRRMVALHQEQRQKRLTAARLAHKLRDATRETQSHPSHSSLAQARRVRTRRAWNSSSHWRSACSASSRRALSSSSSERSTR